MPPQSENLEPVKTKRTRKARVVPIRIIKTSKKPRKKVPKKKVVKAVTVKTTKAIKRKKPVSKTPKTPKTQKVRSKNPALETSLDIPTTPSFEKVVVVKKKEAKPTPRYGLLFLLNVSIIIIVGVVFWSFYSKPTPRVAAISMPTVDLQVITGEVSSSTPQTISIPSVGINAHITPVGLTVDGNMNVPESFDNVGWYKYGPVPGRVGSAVIDGHLDDGKGNPGVFYNLAEVRIGDSVFVFNKNGEKVQFKVTRIQLVDYDAPPIQEIFGETDGEYLNLITCDGIWIPEQKTYSDRLVIFTERVGGTVQ